MSVFDFVTGRSIRKRKIKRAGRNPVIQVVKILMMKRCKEKIFGLRDQVGSYDFKFGVLLGVLLVIFFFLFSVAGLIIVLITKNSRHNTNLFHYLIVAENTEADSLIGPEAPKTHASQDDRPLK